MQDYSFEVPMYPGSDVKISINCVDTVFSHRCFVCTMTLEGAVLSVGAPYHAAIHRQCAPLLDVVRQGWPHKLPAQNYITSAAHHYHGERQRQNQIGSAAINAHQGYGCVPRPKNLHHNQLQNP